MIDLIDSSLSSMSPQAPTESTPPLPNQLPFTVQDRVTLSGAVESDDNLRTRLTHKAKSLRFLPL